MAQSELETADWLKESDEESRKIFKESYSSVLRTVADRRRERQERDDDKMEVRGFPAAPPQHDNPAYHAAIQDAYALIAEERNEFLGAQHLIASSDPRLAPLVEKKLNELGGVDKLAGPQAD